MAQHDEELLAAQQANKLMKLAKKVHKRARKVGPTSIAFANHKGGVGKTSLSTNIADEFARTGLRVLVIGLCLQVDMAHDLGVEDSDEGWSVVQAVMGEGTVKIVHDVRPGVDVIFGGPKLGMLESMLGANAQIVPGGDPIAAFRTIMLDVMDPYDVVLIDFPPGGQMAQSMGFTITDWIAVPMKSDRASIDGTQIMHRAVKGGLKVNPDLQYAGAVLFAHNPQATAVREKWEKRLSETNLGLHPLKGSVRHSEKAAQDTREDGLLARELADEASAVSKEEIFKALRSQGEMPPTFSPATSGLARDYQEIAIELLEITAKEAQ